MSLDPQLEDGEILQAGGIFGASEHAVPYALAISDRAIFTVARKRGFSGFGLDSPYYLDRLPISAVRSVHLVRASPVGAYILAGVLVLGGLAAVAIMLAPMLRGERVEIRTAPFIAVAFGLIVAATVKGRRAVIIETSAKRLVLKPPTSLASSREAIARIQSDFIEGCRKAGIPVLDGS